ncbi:MAG TPA: hypothetical protein VFT50_14200 [Baekduia sp.]|nr:hypothetical protein [Baekduia sp.]
MTLTTIGRPLFLGEPVPGSPRVRIFCPYCAGFHTHNMRPDEEIVHRLAPCDVPDSPLHTTGYWIQRRATAVEPLRPKRRRVKLRSAGEGES